MPRASLILSCLALCVLPAHALAQDVSSRKEAAERFDRGLSLFNEGDNTGALSEFKRAYELAPEPVALFNLGLTYAALHRPVEAVDALQAVQDQPSLSPAQRELARSTALDQQRRIGSIHVICNTEANISIDGVELAKTPLTAAVRVAQGTHVVAAAAPDHLARNVEVTVAGGERQVVELHLPTTQSAAAQLTVVSALPAMQVRVDGVSVGHTPLSSSIRVEPGTHMVSGEREGYVPQTRELTLSKGGQARIDLALPEDPQSAPFLRGRLELQLNEAADVFLDGSARGPYATPLSLARGPHRLRVERSGFEAFEREIEITAGQATLLRVPLRPTAATRASYESSARTQNIRAWVTLSAGALVLAAGGSLAVISQQQHAETTSKYNALAREYVRGSEGDCDPQQDKALLQQRQCSARLQKAEASVQTHETWRTVGVIASGVGAAALVTGIVLLVAADRPDRYRDSDTSQLSVHGYVGRGRAELSVSTRF